MNDTVVSWVCYNFWRYFGDRCAIFHIRNFCYRCAIFYIDKNAILGWSILVLEYRYYIGCAHVVNIVGSNEQPWCIMMMSSNANTFGVTGPLCGEITGHRWIPRTKSSYAELSCFIWSAPWINGWLNNREAFHLRRQRADYDVIVMFTTALQTVRQGDSC